MLPSIICQIIFTIFSFERAAILWICLVPNFVEELIFWVSMMDFVWKLWLHPFFEWVIIASSVKNVLKSVCQWSKVCFVCEKKHQKVGSEQKRRKKICLCAPLKNWTCEVLQHSVGGLKVYYFHHTAFYQLKSRTKVRFHLTKYRFYEMTVD